MHIKGAGTKIKTEKGGRDGKVKEPSQEVEKCGNQGPARELENKVPNQSVERQDLYTRKKQGLPNKSIGECASRYEIGIRSLL